MSITTANIGFSVNLSALPDQRAADAPEAPCIADDLRALANAEFLDAVKRAAAALRNQGIGSGDVVAIMLPNTVDLVVVLFAAWRLGAAVTPINPALSSAEAGYQIGDSDARLVIAAETVELGCPALAPARLAAFEAAEEPESATEPAALALLIYTSGTTGRPKGVMLDHNNITAMSQMVVENFRLTSADHSLLILPLFHVNGIVVSTLAPLIAGGQATVAGRFDPQTFFERVQRSRATYFSGVPTIYTMLAHLPTDSEPDTSSLRFAVCGAAPASVELLQKFESRYGVPIVEGYGLTEGTCASTGNPLYGKRKPGTVGLPLPGQRIRIADPQGHPRPDGERGEVLISGPNVMRGYLNQPEATAKTVTNGWLHTGDVGFIDDDGYLVLVDRVKDMIIRGGENIYPKEIETVAYRMDEVAEAAVVGRPDPVYGEQPVMYVAPPPRRTVNLDQLRDQLSASLAKYKRPVSITVLDSLPKNAVGKIDKPALRKLAAAEVTFC